MSHRLSLLLLLSGVLVACAPVSSNPPVQPAASAGWPSVGGDPGGTRHAAQTGLSPANVDGLTLAWEYRTGDLLSGRGRFEATPILVDGTLFVSTPIGRVIALDPATGAERWTYGPGLDVSGDFGDFANRGVSTWLDLESDADAPCRRRIFVAPVDARLIAIDAADGTVCDDFGDQGIVDLNRDLVNEPAWFGEYQVTSPPAVLNDLVIVGSAVADNQRVDAPSGVVRAFDTRTGRLRWRWDPIPRDPEMAGYETWGNDSGRRTGAANVWSIISVDAERDLVFLPVGSAAPDFYGGERLGQNLYANSLVALHGATGEVVWHFQVVHHDLWDYDVPAQPVLTTLERDGQSVPAVVQTTKMGHVFVLHRETGEPLFPVEERPVPASTVPGEDAWPTQPVPTAPPRLVPDTFTPDDAWGLTDADRASCVEQLRGMRAEGIFTPPSLEGTVIQPGNIGGSNWSGLSVDPDRGLAILPVNNFVTTVRLYPRGEEPTSEGEFSHQRGTPYAMLRSFPRSPSGLPCNPPPWSTLAAVDLGTGAVSWQVPLGTAPGLEAVEGADQWGSVSLGGALTTGGGLTFVAGTLDARLYAFETETGRVLWKQALPANANAGPMSFEIDGRPYVVIAAGGHDRLPTTRGDYVLAFALPSDEPISEPESEPVALPDSMSGDLFFGLRYPVRVTLDASNGDVTGTIAGLGYGLSGTFTGSHADDAVDLEVDFEFAEESCTGTMRGRLLFVNHGTMLTGPVVLTGSCADGGEEQGTLTLRR